MRIELTGCLHRAPTALSNSVPGRGRSEREDARPQVAGLEEALDRKLPADLETDDARDVLDRLVGGPDAPACSAACRPPRTARACRSLSQAPACRHGMSLRGVPSRQSGSAPQSPRARLQRSRLAWPRSQRRSLLPAARCAGRSAACAHGAARAVRVPRASPEPVAGACDPPAAALAAWARREHARARSARSAASTARRRARPRACWTSWSASCWRASAATPPLSATTRASCRRWPRGARRAPRLRRPGRCEAAGFT